MKINALLSLVVTPLLLSSCSFFSSPKSVSVDGTDRLSIITPHQKMIEAEWIPVFKAYHKEKTGRDNIIYIGEKPFMNYVTGVVTQFKTKGEKEVSIKARGKFISRAVDVAEFSAKKFLKEENIRIKDIKINSEVFLQ